MLRLSYFKNDKQFDKKFRNPKRLKRFIQRKGLTTFILNGWWNIYIKEGGGTCSAK